jgi:hypothetical protein
VNSNALCMSFLLTLLTYQTNTIANIRSHCLSRILITICIQTKAGGTAVLPGLNESYFCMVRVGLDL